MQGWRRGLASRRRRRGDNRVGAEGVAEDGTHGVERPKAGGVGESVAEAASASIESGTDPEADAWQRLQADQPRVPRLCCLHSA